ncbi:MAG: tetratricopeptide repeat protein [Planctomycetota bacterium]
MTPEELGDLARRAHEALVSGKLDLGLALTDQCVRARPTEPVFYCWRARALLEMDKFTEAIREARQAVRFGPRMVDAHMVLADSAAVLGRKLEAQHAFRKAVRLSDRDPAVLRTYALFMATECGPRLGEQASLEAVEADPESSYAWTALGIAQLRQHRHAEAESSLRRAVQLDKDNAWAKMNLAVLLDRIGKEAEARALVRLLEDDPEAKGFVAAQREADRDKQVALRLLDRQEFVDGYFGGDRRRGWTYYAVPIALVLLAGAVGIALVLATGRPILLVPDVAVACVLVWLWCRRR